MTGYCQSAKTISLKHNGIQHSSILLPTPVYVSCTNNYTVMQVQIIFVSSLQSTISEFRLNRISYCTLLLMLSSSACRF